jgi:hypothetical protein
MGMLMSKTANYGEGKMKKWIGILMVNLLMLIGQPSLSWSEETSDNTQALEELKKRDPQAHAELEAVMSRQTQITEILSAYYSAELTREEASVRLLPLVEANAMLQIQNADQQIESLKKYLQELEAAKIDPQTFIKNQLEGLLNQGQK